MKAIIVSVLMITALACVQTYRVIVSGSLELKEPIQPVPDPGWSDPGHLYIPVEEPFWEPPVGSTVPGWSIDVFDTSQVIFMTDDSLLEITREGNTITITGPEDVIQSEAPSELNVKKCKHRTRTTFWIGSEKSCKCLNCGETWPGECE